MKILNCTHPLSDEQLKQLTEMTGEHLDVLSLPANFDISQALAPQIAALLDQLGFSSATWQQEPFLVNIPGLAPAAAILLAELHGRCGYFPRIVRLAKPEGSPVFQVAELIDLAKVREDARQKRF